MMLFSGRMASLNIGDTTHTEAHRKKLQENRVEIVQKLENIEWILSHLVDTDCITKLEKESILSESARHNKNRSFIELLSRRPEAFPQFLQALRETQNSPDLYNCLVQGDSAYKALPVDGPPVCGAVGKYYSDLLDYNKSFLDSNQHCSPSQHDLKSHIKLALYPATSQLVETRTGFREMSLDLIRKLGVPIEANKLFSAVPQHEYEPRGVMMLGAPGVGKTATSLFFLKEHSDGKLWLDKFHFVYLIMFRDINNFAHDLSFKDLIFQSYGPVPSDRDRIWEHLESHQEKVLFILDGYDECNGLGINTDPSMKISFNDPDGKIRVQILLHNLIAHKILPKAKVLVTTRPHCADLLKPHASRTVELGGIDWEKLKEMTKKALVNKPELINPLLDFMLQHDNIISLCYSPVNARGFLDSVIWLHSKTTDGVLKESHLPSTRASLLFMLVVNCLRKHDRSLQELSPEDFKRITNEDILKRNKELVVKICELAFDGLFEEEKVKQLFDKDDLDKKELTWDEVTRSGLMCGHVTSVRDILWEVTREYSSFNHLIFEEFFAALALTKVRFSRIHWCTH